MTPDQAEKVRRIYRGARAGRAAEEPDRKLPRHRVAERAAQRATVDIEAHHVRFLECALTKHLDPAVARPIAEVLGVSWGRILQVMGMT